MAESVLHVENVTMQFGGVVAVNNLSMDIYEGEIVALIGPNGAGQNDRVQLHHGRLRAHERQGRVLRPDDRRKPPAGQDEKALRGRQQRSSHPHVVSHTPDYITKMGIARTFQNIRLFKSMTVFDNVLTAMHLRKTSNVFSATFRLNRKEELAQREKTLELLKIVGLDELKDELATSLPYGKQRRLEIAARLRPTRSSCFSTSRPPA
ncbi:MAG: ATP-binding cassette domain-containing protein [Oscillospiraceae bacterium]